MDYKKYIEENTLRCEASYRGGGIEIDLSDLLGIGGLTMTAYQNYLGGGMLGSICNDYNFNTLSGLNASQKKKLEKVTDALNRYFHALTNHEGDEWEETTFERGQLRPAAAY